MSDLKDDLGEHGAMCEEAFGLISGYYLWYIHELSIAAGSEWDLAKPETIDIVVTKENAAAMYDYCKAIRSGYSVGLKRGGMAKIKEARMKAHLFLWEEANNPSTSIERKIELTRLTSKNKSHEQGF